MFIDYGKGKAEGFMNLKLSIQYKSKKELNLFRLWGIKKISHTTTTNRTLEKIIPGTGSLHQGTYQSSDDESGLPESGDEDEKQMMKR